MGSPRIIAGTARGIRLHPVPGTGTRPITDRVKEALFNIIGADIVGARLFDMFGGTGSVGIEALSRGAAFALLVENNAGAYRTIKANLVHTHLDEHAEVILADVFSCLRKPANQTFDYIYIAPPQYKGLWKQAIQGLEQNPEWLAEDGWVIVQIDPKEYEKITWQTLYEFDQRRYGSTLLVFLERHPTNNQFPNVITR
ncbi:MAG: 16S rRNA (guanine(966)-N(2))-methyltransferase RsmD [Anaerolineaceae bacterium]|nr:16S rRNA (guanine(966)-N(2))-methyltransferase RsmD [Anaerolineaceae bacterium]